MTIPGVFWWCLCDNSVWMDRFVLQGHGRGHMVARRVSYLSHDIYLWVLMIRWLVERCYMGMIGLLYHSRPAAACYCLCCDLDVGVTRVLWFICRRCLFFVSNCLEILTGCSKILVISVIFTKFFETFFVVEGFLHTPKLRSQESFK